MTNAGPDTFTRDVFAWEDQVVGDRGLTPLALHVALVIRQHLNRKTGEAFPSQARICELLKASRRGVQGAIDQLVSRRHLKVISAANRKGGNRYRPLLSGDTSFAVEANAEALVGDVHAHGGAHEMRSHAQSRAHETVSHVHAGAHETALHAHGGAHDDSSHAHENAVLMCTPVRTNHLKEPLERDSPSLWPNTDTPPKQVRPKPDKPAKRSSAQSPQPRGNRIDPAWRPDPRGRAYAEEQGLAPAEVDREADSFRDHWLAESSTKALKRDWDAAWRTWVRNAIRFRERDRVRDQQQPGNTRGRSNGQRFSALDYVMAQEADVD